MPEMSQGLVWISWVQLAIVLAPPLIAMAWLEMRDHRDTHHWL
jgi:hypothetical protein